MNFKFNLNSISRKESIWKVSLFFPFLLSSFCPNFFLKRLFSIIMESTLLSSHDISYALSNTTILVTPKLFNQAKKGHNQKFPINQWMIQSRMAPMIIGPKVLMMQFLRRIWFLRFKQHQRRTNQRRLLGLLQYPEAIKLIKKKAVPLSVRPLLPKLPTSHYFYLNFLITISVCNMILYQEIVLAYWN